MIIFKFTAHLKRLYIWADTIPIIRAVNISDNNNADKTDNIINTVKEQVEKKSEA